MNQLGEAGSRQQRSRVFSAAFSDEPYEKIQKYKRENDLSTQSKAVAQLVALAPDKLEMSGKTNGIPSLSTEAMKAAKDYQGLDRRGNQAVRSVIADEQARCADGLFDCSKAVNGKRVGFRGLESFGAQQIDVSLQSLAEIGGMNGIVRFL